MSEPYYDYSHLHGHDKVRLDMIAHFMKATGCSDSVARSYLWLYLWDYDDALTYYHTTHPPILLIMDESTPDL